MAQNRTTKSRRRPNRSRRRDATAGARAGADAAGAAVLGEGIAITGELRIKLFGVGLLPIEVKLMISSAQLAEALGLAWWPARGAPASAVRAGNASSIPAVQPSSAAAHRNGATRRTSRPK